MKDVKNRLEKLESENQILNNKLEILAKENAELKEKLGLNSKNSPIPSSKELYKIKKENKQKSYQNIDGQKGHKGFFCERMGVLTRAGQIRRINVSYTKFLHIQIFVP